MTMLVYWYFAKTEKRETTMPATLKDRKLLPRPAAALTFPRPEEIREQNA